MRFLGNSSVNLRLTKGVLTSFTANTRWPLASAKWRDLIKEPDKASLTHVVSIQIINRAVQHLGIELNAHADQAAEQLCHSDILLVSAISAC